MSFTGVAYPGAHPGSVCLLCGEYLFTGDTLFAGSVGRTDLPGGSTRQLSDSLRKLAGLPIPPTAQVLPGHGDLSHLWGRAEEQLVYPQERIQTGLVNV